MVEWVAARYFLGGCSGLDSVGRALWSDGLMAVRASARKRMNSTNSSIGGMPFTSLVWSSHSVCIGLESLVTLSDVITASRSY